jgi:hypothetical protein
MSRFIPPQHPPLAAASVRLSRREYTHLLAQLDRAAGPLKPFAAGNRRIQQRIPFHREARLLCRLTGDAQPPALYLVRCRNICKRGIGFLHGLEIEPGTRCDLTLVAADGQAHEISGTVVRSRVIAESVFEVGVRFDLPIHLEEVHRRAGSSERLSIGPAPSRRAM